jgi:uncharacterized protein YoxC
MNAAGLAALIAAVFWALLVCVGVIVLVRLGRLLSESSRLVADLRERGDVLLARAQAAVDGAQAAVDRAGRQLDHTASVAASMDELGLSMDELAGQVTRLAREDDGARTWGRSTAPDRPGSFPAPGAPAPRSPWPPREGMAGLGRGIAGGPLGRTVALAYGVRHAVGLRRAESREQRSRHTLPGRVVQRAELARREKAAR